MEIIIVTGMSGAGKSGAIDCFEDMGYYCIDNLPPSLIKNFIDLIRQGSRKVSRTVFMIDIRGGEFFDDLKNSLTELTDAGLDYTILFLDASDEVLLRRFSETRRTHPLAAGGANLDAIRRERTVLSAAKKQADFVIDTSQMKPAELNQKIKKIFQPMDGDHDFQINVLSFGFKYGLPAEADMMFDMRFIPNPFYEPELKPLNGNCQKVRAYVMQRPESAGFRDVVFRLVEELIPAFVREGKNDLKLAFGCTGGQHRSVSMANEFYEALKEKGYSVTLKHRELEAE